MSKKNKKQFDDKFNRFQKQDMGNAGNADNAIVKRFEEKNKSGSQTQFKPEQKKNPQQEQRDQRDQRNFQAFNNKKKDSRF